MEAALCSIAQMIHLRDIICMDVEPMLIGEGAGESAPSRLGSDELTGAIALVERQQVVVPFAVCMSPKVWVLTSLPNNADVHFAAAGPFHCVEVFLFGINPADCFFACHAPVVSKISDVCDVLMAAHTIGLCYTRDLKFWHTFSPS
jgi:hypothetical protein